MRTGKFFTVAGWLGCGFLMLMAAEVSARDSVGFSNASFNGRYASMGVGRGGVTPAAGMTTLIADGKGRFVGKTVFNRPDGEFGERTVVTFPIKGVYKVAKDGTGLVKIFLPPDVGEPQTGHFMITQTSVNQHKRRVATEIALILDKLLPNSAALQTSVLKRQSRRNVYGNASLKGTYASMGVGRGGVVPAAGMTTITADGYGGFVGKTVFNRPVGEHGERKVVSFPIKGTYEVEKDGSGTIEIFPPAGISEPQTGHIMITKAHSQTGRDKKSLATELSFILDELLPNSAALQTSELKRLSN